jgi:O-antigen ligase
LITAQDMALAPGAPAQYPSPSEPASVAVPPFGAALLESPPLSAAPFRERLLLVVIYVTVLASSAVFIEPSPHDALMGILALASFAAGVRFDRKFAPLFLFLLVWNVGGLLSLLNVLGQEKTVQYSATSVYLAIAAVIWACVFAQNTMMRFAAVRKAYIFTAVIGALAGITGYFSMFPHAHEWFAHDERALGAFKDPNVYAPFLIWPILVLFERMLARRIILTDIAITALLLLALLLAFSRGAWFHFAVSCAVMLALVMLTAPTQKARLRVVALSAIALGIVVAFMAILLTMPAIGSMFQERAHLIQYYDVGQGGRFRLQELALAAVLDFPNGMGPFGFASTHTNQQHNVYLQALLVYGWLGAMGYFMLIFSTLLVGFRALFVRAPWQPYMIVAYSVFVGEVAEGFVIDSDHWRHFFLLLGMIWGLAVATTKYLHSRQTAPAGRWAPAMG